MSTLVVVCALASHAEAQAPAGDDATLAQCSAAYEAAQEARRDRRFADARKQLALCLEPACPSFAREDCGRWLSELDAEQPTVVIEAIDENGQQILSGELLVDGQPQKDGLAGLAMELDPGVHTFEVRRPGEAPLTTEKAILTGEKNQRVRLAASLKAPPNKDPSPPPPRTETPSSSSPVVPLIIGGLGLASFGGFAGFGLHSIALEDDLRETCGPTRTCTEGEIDEVTANRTVADIFLGAGVVLVGVSTVWLIAIWTDSPNTETATSPLDLRVGPRSVDLVLTF